MEQTSGGKTIMSEKLKPCPFCGQQAVYDIKEQDVSVICLCCQSRSDFYKTKVEAAKAWNKRSFEALKPCPNCGSQAYIFEETPEESKDLITKFRALCPKCLKKSNYLDTRAEAIEAWNEHAEILPCGKS